MQGQIYQLTSHLKTLKTLNITFQVILIYQHEHKITALTSYLFAASQRREYIDEGVEIFIWVCLTPLIVFISPCFFQLIILEILFLLDLYSNCIITADKQVIT